MPDTAPAIVPLQNPRTGAIDSFHAEDVPDLLDLGYVQPSPEDAAAAQAHQAALESAGGVGGGFGAFGEGLASGATLGASDLAERDLGASPEGIAAREEAHPVAHALGSVIGGIGPLLLPVGEIAEGAGALAKAGKTASYALPTALLGRAGGAVAGEAGALGAGRIAQGFARGITEGVGFGAGNVAHELAIQNPNETAENAVISTIGSGLLGGVFGAGAGAVEPVLTKLLARGEGSGNAGIVDTLKRWTGDKLDDIEIRSNVKATDALPSVIDRIKNRTTDERYGEIAKALGSEGIVGVGVLPPAAYARATKLVEDNGERIGKMLDEVSESATPRATTFGVEGQYGARPAPRPSEGTEAPDINEIVARARKNVVGPLLGSDNPSKNAAGEKLSDQLDVWQKKYADGMTFRNLHNLEVAASDEAFGWSKGIDPLSRAYGAGMRSLNRMLSDDLDQAVTRAGIPRAEWEDANFKFSVGKAGQQLAKSGIKRERNNNLLSLTEIMAGLTATAVGGPVTGALGTLAFAAARRHGAGVLGAGARGLRGLIGEGAEAIAPAVGAAVRAEAPGVAAETAAHPFAMPASSLHPPAASPDPLSASDIMRIGSSFRNRTGYRGLSQGPSGMFFRATPASDGLLVEAFSPEREPLGQVIFPALKAGDLSAGLAEPIDQISLGQHYARSYRPIIAEDAKQLARHTSGRNLSSYPAPVITPEPPAPPPETALAHRILTKNDAKIDKQIDGAAEGLTDADARKKAAKALPDALTPEAFSQTAQAVRNLSSDPAALSAFIQPHLDEIHDHAPQTTGALATTIARALTYLQSQLPIAPVRGPLAPRWNPSQADLAKFNGSLQAVRDPIGTLEGARNGLLSQQQVVAIHSVYPELSKRVDQALTIRLGQLQQDGVTPDYQAMLMASRWLGRDLDGSLSALAYTHAATTPTQFGGSQAPQPPHAPRFSTVGAGKLTIGQRTAPQKFR